jgi:hypothetical protein
MKMKTFGSLSKYGKTSHRANKREYRISQQIFHELTVSEVMIVKESAQLIFAHKKLTTEYPESFHLNL